MTTHDQLFAVEKRMRAEAATAAAKRAAEADAHREAHWDAKEREWAADRRRAAGITAAESQTVEYMLRWLAHVDRLRHSNPAAAIAAYGRMHAQIDRIDPPDANGQQRLWAFAATEANERYRHGSRAKRLLTPGFWAWSLDVRLGHVTAPAAAPGEPPAASATATAPTSMRTDASAIARAR